MRKTPFHLSNSQDPIDTRDEVLDLVKRHLLILQSIPRSSKPLRMQSQPTPQVTQKARADWHEQHVNCDFQEKVFYQIHWHCVDTPISQQVTYPL